MKHRIQVTQRHINEGIKDSETSCMVALALQDAGFINPAVLVGMAYDDEGIQIDGSKPVDFPDSLSEKICAFEFGKAVSPFWFDVYLIDGDIVEVGEAFDTADEDLDCSDLISEIESFLHTACEVKR